MLNPLDRTGGLNKGCHLLDFIGFSHKAGSRRSVIAEKREERREGRREGFQRRREGVSTFLGRLDVA